MSPDEGMLSARLSLSQFGVVMVGGASEVELDEMVPCLRGRVDIELGAGGRSGFDDAECRGDIALSINNTQFRLAEWFK